MTTLTFTCTWCQTSDHAPSAMQPAFCTECVHAMLQGHGETRKTPDSSLTTTLTLDGHEIIKTHASAAARDAYLRYNYDARIVPPAGPDLSSQPLNSPGAPSAPDAGRRADPKEIRYSRADRDYTASYDGMYIGSFPSHLAAEHALDDYALGLLEDGLIDTVPAAISAGPAEIVPDEDDPPDYEDQDYEPRENRVYARPAEVVEPVYGAVACHCGAPIAYLVRESRRGAETLHRLCGDCYLHEFIESEENSAAWELAYCDNCAAPATTTIDLIQLCDACERAAQTRLLRATFGHVCLSCGDPVVQEGLCEACQETGEPWPVVQAIQDGHAASGLIPVLALHAWATTDRPAFRAALAGLSAAQLEWQAAIYAAYLTMQTERTVTTEATLTHFRRSVAIHWSCATPTAKETTMNHTPGPWEVSTETDGRRKGYIRAPQARTDSAPNPAVARVVVMPGWESNAHLIAAAPDLLAACEAALNYWQATGFANCEPGCTCIVDLMRAVIAKARHDKAPV